MKCSDCGVNEAISDDRCLECIENERHAENAGYIPVSEIQRVIDELDDMAKYHDQKYRDIRERNREYHEGKVDGLDKAIAKLKGMIPSEPDHSGVSGNAQETEQDAERQNGN